MLKFLGNGAAFNYNNNNNCAYFIENNNLYLFDCGEKIFDKILNLKLLDNIDNIYCFITHLHSDHVSALQPMLYYIKKMSNKNIKIFYPKAKRLKQLLKLMGTDFDFEIYDKFDLVKNIKVEAVTQKHIFGSYGYFVYSKTENFFYSGDTCKVNKRAVEELEQNKIDTIYHEVTTNKNAKIHTYIKKLTDVIQPALRNKVVLMHFPNNKTIKKAKEFGFAISSEIKK